VPVIGTFLVVAASIGVYLAISMFRDTVVNEPVARGTALARGGFVSEAHETTESRFGSVVIWGRAFSVSFGRAELRA
jgi:hypothetical protein